MAKRAFDLFVSSFLIVLLSPLMLACALLVRRAMGKPVLFRQARPGLHGKPFVLLKFRTMNPGAASDAERLTPLGRRLRRTSLDELPQLFNVLRGDMSLVGPRPLLMEYLPLYDAEQRRRHDVRPGITGWAQVNGRNALSWEERFRMDVWYADRRSFGLDLKILGLTLRRVLQAKGVNEPGAATMTPFRGNGGRGSRG